MAVNVQVHQMADFLDSVDYLNLDSVCHNTLAMIRCHKLLTVFVWLISREFVIFKKLAQQDQELGQLIG